MALKVLMSSLVLRSITINIHHLLRNYCVVSSIYATPKISKVLDPNVQLINLHCCVLHFKLIFCQRPAFNSVMTSL